MLLCSQLYASYILSVQINSFSCCRKVGTHNLNISESIGSDPMYTDIIETAQSSKLAVEKLLYRSGASLQVC